MDFAAKKVTVTGDVTPLTVLSTISKVKNAQFWPEIIRKWSLFFLSMYSNMLLSSFFLFCKRVIRCYLYVWKHLWKCWSLLCIYVLVMAWEFHKFNWEITIERIQQNIGYIYWTMLIVSWDNVQRKNVWCSQPTWIEYIIT